MPTYTDILFRLLADWPEQRYSVKALAARFYVGADTEDDLRRLAKPLHGWSGKPPLTIAEVDAIVEAKGQYA
jgi:hypothetical protein